MKRPRHSLEQFATKWDQAATGVAAGRTFERVCMSRLINQAAYNRWQEQNVGADLHILKELLKTKW